MTVFLGINCAYHENAAAIVRDGEVVHAVEEERLSRIKHAKAARVDNAAELPWQSIELCLEAASVSWEDLSAIGVSMVPGRRAQTIGKDPYAISESIGFGTPAGEQRFDEQLKSIPQLIAQRADDASLVSRVRFLPHHLCHAASAYYPSPFDRAVVLVIDGIGENATAWWGAGEGIALRKCGELDYPHSIGLLWERIAIYCGFSGYDAGKVMGLAAYGDPERFREPMQRLLRVRRADRQPIEVDATLARFRTDDVDGLISLFGSPDHEAPAEQTALADVAAALQEQTTEAVLALAEVAHQAFECEQLAYAGGVALNCVSNAELERRGPFDALYVQSAAHDAGTALGAALYLHHQASDTRARVASDSFLGPRYDDNECADAIAGREATRLEDPELLPFVARAIADGKVVAWFGGALELGPRALGARSILADPRSADARQRLNQKVKLRELYRPFAASVLDEALADWFVLPARQPGARASRDLMLLAYPVRPERREQIPAVVHEDGSCRVQGVVVAESPRYHRLIEHFAQLTGVPLLLNTSFNRQEPIVCSPQHALATFDDSGIDLLVLGNWLLER